MDRDTLPSARPQYTPDGNRYYAAPPFLPQNTAQTTTSSRDPPSLPFHWVEVGNLLLDAASDDLVDPDQIRRLLKDLREVRMAKMRSGVDVLDAAATGGGGVALTGVGSMELGEERGFVTGVVDGLRYVYLVLGYRVYGFIGKSVANWLIGELGPPRSRLDVNRWPSREQMVATMGPRTMKKKITWSSKHLRYFFACFGGIFHLELFSAYVTQTNAQNDVHVYNPIYPPDPMTNGYNQNCSNLINTIQHANALIQE